MVFPLTDELRQALAQHPEGVEFHDSQTDRLFVLTDAKLYRKALQALQQQLDTVAIEQGVSDKEAGRLVPLHEAVARIRTELGIETLHP